MDYGEFRETAFAHSLRKIDRTLSRTRSRSFPHITERGRWQVTVDGSWTGGLWVGQLWWAYEHTGQVRSPWILPRSAQSALRKDRISIPFSAYSAFSAVNPEPRGCQAACRAQG